LVESEENMAIDLAKLRGEYTAKLNEAKVLQEKAATDGKLSPEVKTQIEGLLGKTDEIKAQIELGQRIETGEHFDKAPVTLPVSFRQSAPGEGDAPVDAKAWREMEVKTKSGPMIIRYNVPLAVQKKEYAPAFDAYLHKGINEMGPQDRKTLSEGIDSAGGFLVPEDWQASLIRKMAANATVRANARVIQTSRDVVSFPKVQYTTNDQYTSGVRLTWTGEAPAPSTVHRVTDPVFGEVKIPVHTAMASMPLYNNLIEDAAFDMLGIGSDLMAEAFNLGENDCFWTGDGINKPMGLLTQVNGDGPASVSSGSAGALLGDGLISLVYDLPEQYDVNAKLFWSKATEAGVRKLQDGNKRYLWPVNSDLAGAPKELLGYPYVRDSFLPTVAAGHYPIVFGDMHGYYIVDRVGISIQRLSELYAESNITLLLARKRVGGQCVEPWRLRVQKVSA
jgi:HK97 family phage major capsid protein